MRIEDILLRRDLPINITIVVVTFILSISMFNRHASKYNELKKNIAVQIEKNNKLNDLEAAINKITSIKKNFWEANSSLQNIITDDLNKKLAEIVAYNIKIATGELEDKKSYILLPISVEFQTDYKSLSNFLRYIDENPKILRIGNIDISKVLENSEYVENKLDIKILLYSYCWK